MDLGLNLMEMLESECIPLSIDSKRVICLSSASFGAGIVVESLFVPQLFSRLLYNPLCTLLLGDPTLPPNRGSNQDVSIN